MRVHRRARRRSLLLAAVLLGWLLGPLVLAAPPAVAAPEDPVKVVVVLDVSGSMGRPGGNRLTLLGGARRAIGELTRTLPPDVEIGLRVYGADYGGEDRRRSCRDTRLLVPVGPGNGSQVVAATRTLRPTGDTPIGLALKYAAGDLSRGKASQRVIVLVSDGEDNCSPQDVPPCQVVAGLRQGGLKVRIESVGIALAGQARAQRALRCVANRTGGSYYDAADADAVSAALERISSRTLGSLGAGTRVPGSASLRQARTITPGSYRTEVLPGGERWFRFRARAGDRPRVLSTVQGLRRARVPAAFRDCPAWRVELFNPYGEGGTYPPYGNAGTFDGIGLGTTGASSSGPVRRYSLGIDYSGLWSLRLSLAGDTLDGCSQTLPQRAYAARFTLDLDGGRLGVQDPASPRPSAIPSPSPTADPAPTPSPSPLAAPEPAASEKYQNPIDPEATPGWVYPAVAVSGVVLLGVVLVVVRIVLRRRRQGW